MNTPPDFKPGHQSPGALDPTAYVFAFVDGRLVTRGTDEAPEVLQLSDLDATGSPDLHYLGALGGRHSVALALPADYALPEGWKARGLRSLFFRLSDPLIALAGRAFQVVDWDATHRYCGRCGTATVPRAHERARECPACGLVAYPRVSPAMMALVIREREILLARAPRFPGAMYSALAGFVEPGESIEDCVHREVREEVGIEVDRLEYFASQSWPFPHSLMIAFTAHYAAGELAPDPAEIAEARWFPLDALPDLPSPMSIARRLIDSTVARLRARG